MEHNVEQLLADSKKRTIYAAMSESITATSTNLNTFITDNSQMLTDAVTNMNSIDYDKLNQAITDLQTAVEPFANFMSRFK